jgi:hypothetical protein
MTQRRGPGRPFQPGNRFGKGRPQGSRNHATVMAESLLAENANEIFQKAIDLALEGRDVALRLCVERLLPPRRDRTVRIKLPADTGSAQGVAKVSEAVMKAAAQGEITTHHALQLANVLEIQRKAIETSEVDARLRAIERMILLQNETEDEMKNGELHRNKVRRMRA